MHKSKVAIGIGIMVAGGIFLATGTFFHISVLNAHFPSMCDSCPIGLAGLANWARLNLILGTILVPVGIWLFIFGIKEISLISFSKES